MKTTHKGIYYFKGWRTAHCYADVHGWPTDRILRYDLGWAIQLRVSGPYVGPDTDPRLSSHFDPLVWGCELPGEAPQTHGDLLRFPS